MNFHESYLKVMFPPPIYFPRTEFPQKSLCPIERENKRESKRSQVHPRPGQPLKKVKLIIENTVMQCAYKLGIQSTLTDEYERIGNKSL